MVQGKYIKYTVGSPEISCHVDAVHAQPPKSDMKTGEIAEKVAERTGAGVIIATVSREEMDLNRPPNPQNQPAIDEYRAAIQRILESKNLLDKDSGSLTREYLHIALHGMKDDWGTNFEVGTLHGRSCKPSVLDWFIDQLKTAFSSAKIGVNGFFQGNGSKSYHRYGDPHSAYPGYGERFNTIQLEICHEYRTDHQEKIVDFLCETVTSFDHEFNPI